MDIFKSPWEDMGFHMLIKEIQKQWFAVDIFIHETWKFFCQLTTMDACTLIQRIFLLAINAKTSVSLVFFICFWCQYLDRTIGICESQIVYRYL